MSVGARSVPSMMIDCGSCAVRGQACADCVVTFLTVPVRARSAPPGQPAGTLDLDAAERDALGVLAESGLVPPLRMRPAM